MRTADNNMRTMRMSLLLALLSTVSLADDWTVGPGGKPARNGLSDERGPTSAAIAWGQGLPAIIAQQAVIEDNVVVMARIFDLGDVLHGTLLVAHNLITGDTLWTRELPVDFPSTDWRSRISGMRDGRVYATRAGNTNASYVCALDATTGNQVWRSQDLVTESTTEGCTFAPDGDIITTGLNSVVRINSSDGFRVWSSARTCPTTGGCDPVVFGNRVYLWEAGFQGPVITAFNLSSGARLYSSPGISPGLIQQLAPFVGPDGTVYAPRSMNNTTTDFLVALQDTGTGFRERWRVPLGFVPFATFGIGPDGSVYAYSREFRVLRLHPGTGAVIDSSQVITSDFYQPRMAIDSSGIVYVTNGGFSQGAVFSFNPDLTLRWTEAIMNVNVGGPALGRNSTLIVCGVGTDVRAYRTAPLSVEEPGGVPAYGQLHQNYPNPFNSSTTIQFSLNAESYVSLEIVDALGRVVTDVMQGRMQSGTHTFIWNAAAQSTGAYYYRLRTDGKSITRRMLLIK